MDLILEVFDTIFFDKFYAKLLPADGCVAQALGSSGALNSTATAACSMLPDNLKSVALTLLTAQGSATQDYSEPFLFNANSYTYASLLPRNSVFREALSLFLITWVFGYVLYLLVAGVSYRFFYDPINFKHPKYLKNQVRLELMQSITAIPIMTALTVPWFVLEVQGYSKLYMDSSEYGTWYMVLQFPLFILFTDACIYCIHRWLHWPMVYKYLHKPHHKWIVPTPFASHAFHPVDGYFQSLAYHVFPFIFPLHKVMYVVLFMVVNVWSVMIHDGEYLSHDPVVNGSACHTVHHLYFNYNYGQYTTLWDRLGGSYRRPDKELYDKSAKMSKATWDKQVKQMEEIVQQVEEEDTRVYANDDKKNI